MILSRISRWPITGNSLDGLVGGFPAFCTVSATAPVGWVGTCLRAGFAFCAFRTFDCANANEASANSRQTMKNEILSVLIRFISLSLYTGTINRRLWAGKQVCGALLLAQEFAA